MTIQTAGTNSSNTEASNKHPSSHLSPRPRVSNKTAKSTLEVSVSTPPPKSTSPKTTKLAGTDYVVVSHRDASSKASSKQAVLIGLIKRPEGASLSELMSLSGWQAHSVRGWISSSLRKKLGLVVYRFIGLNLTLVRLVMVFNLNKLFLS